MRDCIRDAGSAGVRGVNVLARCSRVRPEALGLLVSPVYAHGSCYATNRVLIDARWLLSGPAAPFLSTTGGSPGPRVQPPAAGDPLQHEPCAYLGRTGAEGDRGDNVTGRFSGRIRWPSTCATAPGDAWGQMRPGLGSVFGVRVADAKTGGVLRPRPFEGRRTLGRRSALALERPLGLA